MQKKGGKRGEHELNVKRLKPRTPPRQDPRKWVVRSCSTRLRVVVYSGVVVPIPHLALLSGDVEA